MGRGTPVTSLTTQQLDSTSTSAITAKIPIKCCTAIKTSMYWSWVMYSTGDEVSYLWLSCCVIWAGMCIEVAIERTLRHVALTSTGHCRAAWRRLTMQWCLQWGQSLNVSISWDVSTSTRTARDTAATCTMSMTTCVNGSWNIMNRWDIANELWAGEKSLPSVLWHCWLGHLTRKNPSPIWPIMCLVGR